MRRGRLLCASLLVAALLTVSGLCASAQTAPPFLNGDFETGLSGWTVEGEASLDTKAPLHGKGSLRLGPGKSAARQRIVLGGLRILLFEATLRTAPAKVGGAIRAQCYDAQDRLLLDIRQEIGPLKAGPKGERFSLFFKTQLHTTYVVLSIEKDTAEAGYVYADVATVVAGDQDGSPPAPLNDLRQEMQPVWQGKTVYHETVLLLSKGGRPAVGRLLFKPTRILSVQDYAQTTAYVQGRDYTLDGRTLTVLPGTRMPIFRAAKVSPGDYQWYKLDGRHIVVTYTHEDAWSGLIPTYQGDLLPRTENRLRRHLPLTIVTQGDSITLGNDGSGFLRIPPYLPTWPELFVERLKAVSGDADIRLYNTALGGTTAEWGRENADSTVAALDPDLVIIAFGMNDVWSVPAEQFRANIQGILHRVRVRRPNTEFILVASMSYDPAYAPDTATRNLLASYVSALKSLTGLGVRLLDMHALSLALFAAKKPKDFLSNPMHPNDFLGRWYAQSLVAMLDRSAVKTVRAPVKAALQRRRDVHDSPLRLRNGRR